MSTRLSPSSSSARRFRRGAYALAALGCVATLAGAPARAEDTDKTFATFKDDAFGARPIEADSPLVILDAPKRAEDAAVVPIDVQVRLPDNDPRSIAKVTLIVDENPSPVAATFALGQKRQEFGLSTRLRVNAYSSVRAVVETDDGKLHMAARFVKASGGCSAPALKDEDQALAHLGEMKFRRVTEKASEKPSEANAGMSQAQLMIRHPNFSGLQMDPISRSYVPARFVNHIVVKQGEETVFTMDGGISLSEDPAISFTYPTGKGGVTVAASDTEGVQFTGALDQKKPGS
ncbi:sulfur-oxidizing protein SoxY [Methylopila capsulata]|uniref:Quinoprotein dehydrogenase-associated SoxYZ-like carrier n=1 Tax=Methylopila capsulata TaxID=61654 RepID=A0A9W6IS41_9HYPH|nr:quinoprotein dehydrogenase-associated SoxYZ-like carrier [Methylopila capsulata]MBM7850225.1 sulfur-oxidizing protein SoxY [Methylopila capsulata]GLK55517.1 quinoprotein dehydrogenase-associated SoxYZ-like carrier [Methylopila capsulata]